MDAIVREQHSMATQDVLSAVEPMDTTPGKTRTVLVSLPSMPHGALLDLLDRLTHSFSGYSVVVASPDSAPDADPEKQGNITLLGYTPAVPHSASWTLTAADFVNAKELHLQHGGDVVVILGGEAQSLTGEAIVGLVETAQAGADLAVARYDLGARAGLVNSAILFPVARALFAARPRFPLPLDMAVSPRMLDRLAAAGQKLTALNQPGGIVWPVAEAATAGYSVAEVHAGARSLPQPETGDLNTLLAQITGSLFADVDSKAAWWQRARPMAVALTSTFQPERGADTAAMEQVKPMLDTFRLAYGNLHDLWSLVLPPQSLLGLKRLSTASPGTFQMADALWARIVYDFLLAYRLRTINRGHLLGALTPLYLAWVASHILLTASGGDPERHIEAVALAFEADKPYLVSRWRWPDRFNP